MAGRVLGLPWIAGPQSRSSDSPTSQAPIAGLRTEPGYPPRPLPGMDSGISAESVILSLRRARW